LAEQSIGRALLLQRDVRKTLLLLAQRHDLTLAEEVTMDALRIDFVLTTATGQILVDILQTNSFRYLQPRMSQFKRLAEKQETPKALKVIIVVPEWSGLVLGDLIVVTEIGDLERRLEAVLANAGRDG
jgi:hypothetical protein